MGLRRCTLYIYDEEAVSALPSARGVAKAFVQSPLPPSTDNRKITLVTPKYTHAYTYYLTSQTYLHIFKNGHG